MGKDESINYTREAFLHPLNMGVLLVATISAFALADVGLVSNLILSMTFGTELMYLGIVPRLPRFRENVKLKKLRERDAATEEKTVFHDLDGRKANVVSWC
ncbi:MAG: hypothetical protein U5K69_02630 [Balneolaceae bacterium]|nr:hypothetical protein [Balneolaceae bacterium]